MPKPHFNGQLENYDDGWRSFNNGLGVFDPACRKANKARMILTALPLG